MNQPINPPPEDDPNVVYKVQIRATPVAPSDLPLHYEVTTVPAGQYGGVQNTLDEGVMVHGVAPPYDQEVSQTCILALSDETASLLAEQYLLICLPIIGHCFHHRATNNLMRPLQEKVDGAGVRALVANSRGLPTRLTEIEVRMHRTTPRRVPDKTPRLSSKRILTVQKPTTGSYQIRTWRCQTLRHHRLATTRIGEIR